MVLYRVVFQAKFGKASQVKKDADIFTEDQKKSLPRRILTDISGPFDTVTINETTHASLAAVEQFRTAIFAMPEMSLDASAPNDLIVSGRNE